MTPPNKNTSSRDKNSHYDLKHVEFSKFFIFRLSSVVMSMTANCPQLPLRWDFGHMQVTCGITVKMPEGNVAQVWHLAKWHGPFEFWSTLKVTTCTFKKDQGSKMG